MFVWNTEEPTAFHGHKRETHSTLPSSLPSRASDTAETLARPGTIAVERGTDSSTVGHVGRRSVTIQIEFRTDSGVSVPHLQVQLAQLDAFEGLTVGKRRGRFKAIEAGGKSETDGNGQLLVTAMAGEYLQARVLDQKWGIETHDGTAVFRAPDQQHCVWPITVSEDAPVRIALSFADGMAFTGMISVRGTGGWTGPLMHVVNEHSFELGRVDVGSGSEPCAVTLWSRRLGFESRSEFSFPAEQLASGRWLDCVVPFSKEAQCQVVIDLASVRDKPAIRLKITDDQDRTIDDVRVAIAEVAACGYQYHSRILAPGQWRVSVTESGLAWESGLITLTSGEKRVLAVLNAPGGSVSVRFVDEGTKEPVSGGVLSLSARRYLNWETVSRFEHNVVQRSAADGTLVAQDIPSGRRTVAFEAPGYEPTVLELVVVSGQETRCGTVFLRRASGAIQVTIDGARPDQRVFLLLLEPGGGILRGPTPVVGEVVLDGLPKREYVIALFDRSAERHWSQSVHVGDTPSVVSFSLDQD